VVGGNGCPCNFSCLKAGDKGVCWPGGDKCGGGCAVTLPSSESSGTSPLIPILLGALLGALFLWRRR
jgi:hypothetical protein